MSGEETLVEVALRVLNTADPVEKACLGDDAANRWLQGLISRPYDPSLNLPVPDRPARLANIRAVEQHHVIFNLCNMPLLDYLIRVHLGSERHTTEVLVEQSGALQINSSIEGLAVLKTTKSGFEGFIRDKYTMLPETQERILATEITTLWR